MIQCVTRKARKSTSKVELIHIITDDKKVLFGIDVTMFDNIHPPKSFTIMESSNFQNVNNYFEKYAAENNMRIYL